MVEHSFPLRKSSRGTNLTLTKSNRFVNKSYKRVCRVFGGDEYSTDTKLIFFLDKLVVGRLFSNPLTVGELKGPLGMSVTHLEYERYTP